MVQPVSWLVRWTGSHSLPKLTFTNTSELRQCSHHEGQAELASMSELYLVKGWRGRTLQAQGSAAGEWLMTRSSASRHREYYKSGLRRGQPWRQQDKMNIKEQLAPPRHFLDSLSLLLADEHVMSTQMLRNNQTCENEPCKRATL